MSVRLRRVAICVWSMSKRRRTENQTFSVKRPISKTLIAVAKNAVIATEVNTVLLTATFPCTVTGLRWDISAHQDGGTGQAVIHWVIVVVKEGNVVAGFQIADGGVLWIPEETVMAFGVFNADVAAGNQPVRNWEGATKSMRKLQPGDAIKIFMKGTDTNTMNVRGIIQFFCLS